MPGPTTEQEIGGRNKPAAKSKGRQRRRLSKDVKDLEEHQQQVVRAMLIEGATFEDTLEAANEAGKSKIKLRAIQSYFRSNVDVQQERIRHMLKVAGELKKALSDPMSGKAALAESVLITGLMGVTRAEVRAQVQRAFRLKELEENLRLKKQAFRLKSRKLNLDLRVLTVRLEAEIAKRDMVAKQVKTLKEAVEHGDHTLTPDVIRQIQEIYGLVSVNEIGGGGETRSHVQE